MSSFIRWVTRNTRNLVTVLLLLLSFTLILSTGLRMYDAVDENRDIYLKLYGDRFVNLDEKNTTEGERQYLDHVSMEEMVFEDLGYGIAVTLNKPDPYHYEITLPDSITYYREYFGLKIPVKTYPKGTVLTFSSEDESGAGYGFYSYPTYERGWRYVIPFETGEGPVVLDGGYMSVLSQDDYDFYYVRMEDLEMVYRAYMEAVVADQGEEMLESLSLDMRTYNTLYIIDRQLMYDSIYLSPEFSFQVITKWDYILLAASAGCFLMALILLLLSFRKTVR